jgi:hypothetical protein
MKRQRTEVTGQIVEGRLAFFPAVLLVDIAKFHIVILRGELMREVDGVQKTLHI